MPREHHPSPRGRILLVEDDPDTARFISSVLEKRGGYQVEHAPSPPAALPRLDAERWDLIITDIEMPQIDGFAFAAAARAMPAAADIPIIALSAMVSAETIERGRAAGFHDFVAKFDRAGLVAAIKEQSTELDRAA